MDLPILIKALVDDNLESRRYAAKMFQDHDLMIRDAMANVIAACKDKDATVRESAIIALAKSYQGLPGAQAEFFTRYKDEQDRAVKKHVLKALGSIYTPGQIETLDAEAICNVWMPASFDSDPDMRACSGVFLSLFFSPRRPEVVKRTLALLEDSTPDVREQTLNQLRKFAVLQRFNKEEGKTLFLTYAEDAARTLANGFASRQPERRRFSAEVACYYSPDNDYVMPDMAKGLQDSDEDVRKFCVECLNKFGKGALPALAPLLVVLKDHNPEIRRLTVQTVGQLGRAPGVLAGLMTALDDTDADVRLRAQEALENAGPFEKKDVAVIRPALGSNSAFARASAIDLLSRMGANADEAVPDLVSRLSNDKEKEAAVRLRAVQALGKIGKASKPAVPLLAAIVRESVAPDAKRVEATMKSGLAANDLYKRAIKSSVWIRSTLGSGTGALIDAPQRLVLTSYHVVRGAALAEVYFPQYEEKTGELITDKSEYLPRPGRVRIVARVVGFDPSRDLALLQVSSVPKNAETLFLARESARANHEVLSIGSSSDTLLWGSTRGVVRRDASRQALTFSSGQRVNAYVLETDSPINPGDSGGPVVNQKAELVAIAMSYRADQRQVSQFIDVREIREFVRQAARGKEVQAASLTPDSREELVASPNELRQAAIHSLGLIGAEAAGAVSSLGDVVRDKSVDLETRTEAATAAREKLVQELWCEPTTCCSCLAKQNLPKPQSWRRLARWAPRSWAP